MQKNGKIVGKRCFIQQGHRHSCLFFRFILNKYAKFGII
jgi:hypothetical protein